MRIEKADIRRAVLCASLSAGCFSLMYFSMSFGFLSVIVSPLPVAYMALAGPFHLALPFTALAAMALGLGVDPAVGAEYLLQFGFGGLLIGSLMKKGRPPPVVLGGYALLSVLLFTGLMIFNMASAGLGLTGALEGMAAEVLAPLEEALKAGSIDPREIMALEDFKNQVRWSFVNIPFGLVACFGILSGWMNAVVLRRMAAAKGLVTSDWTAYRVPEWVVWAPIMAGLAAFLGDGQVRITGLNVLLPSMALYFLQGIGIIESVFNSWSAPFFLRVLVWAMLFVEARIFATLVASVGAFDQWADFGTRLAPRRKTEN